MNTGVSVGVEKLCQAFLDIFMIWISSHPYRQTFPALFVDHIEEPKSASIVGSFQHEVITPEMVRIFRPPAAISHIAAIAQHRAASRRDIVPAQYPQGEGYLRSPAPVLWASASNSYVSGSQAIINKIESFAPKPLPRLIECPGKDEVHETRVHSMKRIPQMKIKNGLRSLSSRDNICSSFRIGILFKSTA
jgi:hypothetical protein